jgi:hypothetical protein
MTRLASSSLVVPDCQVIVGLCHTENLPKAFPRRRPFKPVTIHQTIHQTIHHSPNHSSFTKPFTKPFKPVTMRFTAPLGANLQQGQVLFGAI